MYEEHEGDSPFGCTKSNEDLRSMTGFKVHSFPPFQVEVSKELRLVIRKRSNSEMVFQETDLGVNKAKWIEDLKIHLLDSALELHQPVSEVERYLRRKEKLEIHADLSTLGALVSPLGGLDTVLLAVPFSDGSVAVWDIRSNCLKKYLHNPIDRVDFVGAIHAWSASLLKARTKLVLMEFYKNKEDSSLILVMAYSNGIIAFARFGKDYYYPIYPWTPPTDSPLQTSFSSIFIQNNKLKFSLNVQLSATYEINLDKLDSPNVIVEATISHNSSIEEGFIPENKWEEKEHLIEKLSIKVTNLNSEVKLLRDENQKLLKQLEEEKRKNSTEINLLSTNLSKTSISERNLQSF